MIFNAAFLALKRLITPEFRWLAWKSLGLTLLLLVFIWFGVEEFFSSFIWPWVEIWLPGLPQWLAWGNLIGAVAFGIGLAAILAVLIAPIIILVGGFFIDDAAEIIEREDYPDDPQGQAMPLARALAISGRFLLLSLIGNLIALILLLVPGVNMIAFVVINGYLIGREYFEFAAARLRQLDDARRFYKDNAATVFLGGLVIGVFLSIPILNVLTPLFAAGMMTHLHKFLSVQQIAESKV